MTRPFNQMAYWSAATHVKHKEFGVFRFWELQRCVGVDEDAQPSPAMLVPFGGSNLVLLETDGKTPVHLKTTNGSIKWEELDGDEIRRKLIDTNIALSQPGVDPQFKAEMMPTSLFWYQKPRFFKIHGKALVGFPGALVQAVSSRGVVATLTVVVVDTLPVKIAFGELYVPDENGNWKRHSKTPIDPTKEIASMNAVWGPQANIRFDLVQNGTVPVRIDDRQKQVKEELASAVGRNDPDNVTLTETIMVPKMAKLFDKLKIGGAQLTFFLVDKLLDNNKDRPSGATVPELGMAFIAGTHGMTTFAHEAGHYLIGEITPGRVHSYDKDKDQDIRMLMRDGGAGWKIPFKLVEKSRGRLNTPSAH
jgi:hypothetical protein